jgi:hypothetical protein
VTTTGRGADHAGSVRRPGDRAFQHRFQPGRRAGSGPRRAEGGIVEVQGLVEPTGPGQQAPGGKNICASFGPPNRRVRRSSAD